MYRFMLFSQVSAPTSHQRTWTHPMRPRSPHFSCGSELGTPQPLNCSLAQPLIASAALHLTQRTEGGSVPPHPPSGSRPRRLPFPRIPPSQPFLERTGWLGGSSAAALYAPWGTTGGLTTTAGYARPWRLPPSGLLLRFPPALRLCVPPLNRKFSEIKGRANHKTIWRIIYGCITICAFFGLP